MIIASIFLFFLFSIGLCKSFYKTGLIITIWSQVLTLINIDGGHTLLASLSFVALLVLFFKIVNKEIVLSECPFWGAICFCIISYMLSFVIAPQPVGLNGVGSMLALYIFPLISFYSISRISSFYRFFLFNFILYAIVLLSVGMIEYINNVNIVQLWLESKSIMTTVEVREDYLRYGYIRCRSLTSWCEPYGVSCGMIFITLLYMIKTRVVSSIAVKLLIWIIVAIAFIGFLSSGTRTVYACIVICSLSYFIYISKSPKYWFIAAFAGIIAYYGFEELIDEIIESMVNHEGSGGSTLEMREGQFMTAFSEFMKSPLYGQGVGACNIAVKKYSALYGAESCLFYILIDRGIIGLFSFILISLKIIKYAYRIDRILIFIPIGILVGRIASYFADITDMYCLLFVLVIGKALEDRRNCKFRLYEGTLV